MSPAPSRYSLFGLLKVRVISDLARKNSRWGKVEYSLIQKEEGAG